MHLLARMVLILALTVSITSCIGLNPSIKHDCGHTPGYIEQKVSEQSLEVTLYWANNWSQDFTDNALDNRARRFCGSKVYKKTLISGVEYLDGCSSSSDAQGENQWLIECR